MIDAIHQYFLDQYEHKNDLNAALSNSGITSQDDCLNQLVALRARQILLTIISEMPARYAPKLTQAELFQLIYDEHAIAANSGFPMHLGEIEESIRKILTYLKNDQPERGHSFVQDLLKRGNLTTQACTEAYSCGGQQVNPGSLPFFAEIVQSSHLYNESSISQRKLERVFYDLMLTMGFSHCASNPDTAGQLFEATCKQLNGRVAAAGLDDMIEADYADFFNNKLIEKVFFQVPNYYSLLFNDKCQPICQIIAELKNLSHQSNLEFQLVPKG